MAKQAKNKRSPNGKKQAYRGKFHSRITAGLDLLPSIDGRSTPARVVHSTYHAMLSHCGGVDHISAARRLLCRRVACLEAELINLELRFAALHVEDSAPSPKALDLYGRLAGQQRRILECLGLNKTMLDITPTPDLHSYIASKYERVSDASEADEAEVVS